MNRFFEKINCPVCKEERYKILYKSNLTEEDFLKEVLRDDFKNSLSNYTKHAQIVKCTKCNLVYVNPVEKIESYLEAYEDIIDEEYLSTEKFRKILALNHLTKLEKFKSKGKILDIGCFAGFFLDLAKDHDWNVYGIEPSGWASKYARKKGIKIIGKEIEETKIKKGEFDAISMWDVIEHLHDPKSAILKAHEGLKKNGVLAIGTPDVDSLIFKLLGSNHPYFIRMHVVLFSPITLRKLLEDNGFKVVKVYKYGRTYPINYFISRIETKLKFVKKLKKFTKADFFSNYPITLNIGDEFGMIAVKK